MKLPIPGSSEMLEPGPRPAPTRVVSQVQSSSGESWAVEFAPLRAAPSLVGAEGARRSGALCDHRPAAPGSSALPQKLQGQVMLVAHIVAMQVSELGAVRRIPLEAELGAAPRRITQEPLVIQMQAVSEHDGDASLHLGHPELGSMVIEIEVRNGRVDLRIVAGSTLALDTLRAGEPGLRANVRAQGIELRKMTVTIARRQRKTKRGARGRQERGQREES